MPADGSGDGPRVGLGWRRPRSMATLLPRAPPGPQFMELLNTSDPLIVIDSAHRPFRRGRALVRRNSYLHTGRRTDGLYSLSRGARGGNRAALRIPFN